MNKNKATAQDWIALGTLMLPVLLVSIDSTVMNLALPMISLEFSSSGTLLLWIVDSYSLVLAGLLVTMGSFADRFGRRRMLMIGGVGFALVSVAAAFAPNAYALVGARVALGLFGSMLMPATLSLLRNIFVDSGQRRMALAVWATGFSAGAALGPVIGGVLLQYFSWGSVFLIAVPLLIPMLILTPIFVPESKDPHPAPVSVINVLLSIATLAPAIFAIKVFATEGATVPAFLSTGVSVGAGLWFGRRQLRSENPMLDLTLFGRRQFTGSVLANLMIMLSLSGFLYFVSQHLQLVVGLSPLDAGLTLIPGTIAMILSGLAVVVVARRFPVNRIVGVSTMFAALAFAALGFFGRGASPLVVAAIFVVLALGIGAAETLTNDAIVSAVPPEKAGAASAISETAYEIGAVLGTAVLGSMLVAAYRNNVVVPSGLTSDQQALAGETLGGATSVAQDLPPGSANSLLESAHHAFDSGVVTIGIIGSLIMAVAAVLAWTLMRRPPGLPTVRHFTPGAPYFDRLGIQTVSGSVVVVDVLRAFTTAAFAFDRGAERIILVDSVEESFELKKRHSDWVLMGEDQGKRVNGFDYTNSPVEVSRANFAGKTIIQRTTAGTRGVVACQNATRVWATGLATASATARAVSEAGLGDPSYVITGSWPGRNLHGDDDWWTAKLIERVRLGKQGMAPQTANLIRESPEAAFTLGLGKGSSDLQDVEYSLEVDRFNFAMEATRNDPEGDLAGTWTLRAERR